MQGYDELGTLERPLVGAADEDDYDSTHGMSRPANEGYQPPTGVRPSGGSITAALPSQADEMRELSVLAKDAAEILWEMVALGEGGDQVSEMKTTATQLQAQLRGIINDYSGGDETLLMGALESFDMLTRCLDDNKDPIAAPAAAAEEAPAAASADVAPAPAAQQIKPAAPQVPAEPAAPAPTTAAAAEVPLISFD